MENGECIKIRSGNLVVINMTLFFPLQIVAFQSFRSLELESNHKFQALDLRKSTEARGRRSDLGSRLGFILCTGTSRSPFS